MVIVFVLHRFFFCLLYSFDLVFCICKLKLNKKAEYRCFPAPGYAVRAEQGLAFSINPKPKAQLRCAIENDYILLPQSHVHFVQI